MPAGLVELVSASVTTGAQVNFTLAPGQYEQLLIEFAGTTIAAQTLLIADLGEMRLTDSKGAHSRVSFSSLQDRAFALGGILEDATGNAASAENVHIPFPFAIQGDSDNIFAVSPNEIVTLTIFPGSNFATRIAGNTWTFTIHALRKTGIQRYRYLLNDLEFGIINGITTEQVQFENIYDVWMENNTNINRIVWKQDGEAVFDTTRDALIQQTHFDNEIETFSATINKVQLLLNRRGEPQKSLNDANEIRVEGSAAADITFLITSMDFTDEEAAATKELDELEDIAVFDRKARLGKVRPANVLAQEVD